MGRKIAAHYLISAGRLYKNPIVEIDDDGVVISVETDVANIDSIAGVEFYNGVLVPGLVNCHCHLEYSYVKGMIPPGSGLPEFIRSIIEIKSKGEIPQKDMAKAAEVWDAVMAESGVVAVGDHNNNDYVYDVKRASKIKYVNFIELFDVDSQSAEKTFEQGLDRMRESSGYGFKSSVVPHANYTMSRDLMRLTGGMTETSKGEKATGIVSVHLKESVVMGGEGETEAIYDCLSPERNKVLLVHSIYATREDIQRMKSKLGDKISVVMCPKSNLYIENSMADVNMLLEEGIRVTLGTDSLSSNTELNMVAEMFTLQKHNPNLKMEQIVDFATRNGAQTLEIDSWAGTIEKGKRPGVVLIDGIDFENMKFTAGSKGKLLV